MVVVSEWFRLADSGLSANLLPGVAGSNPQSFHLLAPFSAVENVAIGLRFGARKSLNAESKQAYLREKRLGNDHDLGYSR